MIKNYIFDFGGVLFKINIKNTLKNIYELSSNKELFKKENIDFFFNHPNILDYEKGTISTPEFRDRCKKDFSLNCTDAEFDDAWNSTLINIFPDSISTVTNFSKTGRVFLLSNSNELHHNHFKNECQELFSLFEKCYFSYQLKISKPDSAIFEFVLNENNLKPDETLFIDDSIANIEGAKKVGLQTFLYSEGTEINVI